MSKYRDDAFDPKQIESLMFLGEEAIDAMKLVYSAKVATTSYDSYRVWMDHWKDVYNDVSKMSACMRNIRDYPNGDVQRARHHFRKLANTLINARQYVIDRRRALREREGEM